MVDETGCKISECAGDHDHTWQKQPEALLAHGVEPWSIGLKDHNDRHMPQVDSVLVSRHEGQWAKNPEIHFRQDGKAHEQYSKQNRKNGMSRITSRSRSVKAVAVIGISDPGEELAAMCYEAGIEVTSLPGPAACITALTLSGLYTRRFAFEAFLPADKKERKTILEELSSETRTIILYEAPHRLVRTLGELREALGNRRMTLCRELTKKHETYPLPQNTGVSLPCPRHLQHALSA